MTVLASAILARVRSQLIDEGATRRWSDAELLRWLSDAERALVAASPSLGEVTAPFALAIGTKQTLTGQAFMLLDVRRNLGEDGATPGRAITVVTRELLDGFDPLWHAGRRSATISNFVYDPRTPKTFYVYPPANGETQIEVSTANTPAEITALDQAITVPDLYQTALFDYVMFRAHQKDTDYAAGMEKAQVYLQLFTAFVGGHEGGKLAESPNTALGPTDLNSKGAAK